MYQAWIRQFSLAIAIAFYTVSCIRPGSDNLVQLYQQYFTLFHVSGLDKTIQSSHINSILHCFMYQAWIRQFSLAISIVFYTVSCIRPGSDNLVQLYQQYFTLFHVSGLDKTQLYQYYLISVSDLDLVQLYQQYFTLFHVSGLDKTIQSSYINSIFTLFHVSGLDKTIQSSYINSILHCFMYQAWIRQFSLAIDIQQYFTLFHVSGLDKTIQSSNINSISHCFMYQAWIRQFSLAYINSILHCFMYQAWIRQFSLAISIVFYTVSCISPG